MSDWQPIETAPKDGLRVIIWCKEYWAPVTAQYYGELLGGWKCDYEMPAFRYQPTHWMPLPEPPKDDPTT